MGELKDWGNAKSPYITIQIGEETEPLIYKGFKQIVNSFGADCIRYLFEVETANRLVSKIFDNTSGKLAQQFDAIPFGSKVVISRVALTDPNGVPIPKKSRYFVTETKEK